MNLIYYSKYLEHVREVLRNVLETFEKSFTLKIEVLLEYSNLILRFIFQNPNFLTFPDI